MKKFYESKYDHPLIQGQYIFLDKTINATTIAMEKTLPVTSTLQPLTNSDNISTFYSTTSLLKRYTLFFYFFGKVICSKAKKKR